MIAGAGGGERLALIAGGGGGEDVDRAVVVVGDVEVAGGVDGEPAGAVEVAVGGRRGRRGRRWRLGREGVEGVGGCRLRVGAEEERSCRNQRQAGGGEPGAPRCPRVRE